jgi:phenylpropionate dioxygenase-like ring-hydroxylating dioxygenase large terminal subunit
MASPLFLDVARRLRDNVERSLPDQTDAVFRVPAQDYRDAALWEREMQEVFLRVPLLVALSCDLPEPGDYFSFDLVGRPLLIVRGDDGRARTFLNICRHRGARLTGEPWGNARSFICPYHSWSYDRAGVLVGLPERESFGEPGVDGLVALSCEERAGAIFAMLEPGADLDLDGWLGEMGESLAALRLADMYPYRKTTTLASPNWKLAADGYLDGYHIGYLHRESIGTRAITNRNTYDLLGNHVRVGFAHKRIGEIDAIPPDELALEDHMSLVHYVFPNVSMSGGLGDSLMLSRLFPGPTVDRSTTVQHQYFRQPVEGELIARAEQKRLVYEQVVRDEDCATVFGIGDSLAAMADQDILFGRNEPANQHLHRQIRALMQD